MNNLLERFLGWFRSIMQEGTADSMARLIFFVIGIVAARNKEKLLQFVRKWKYIIFSGTIVSGLYVFWEGRSRFLSSNNYFNFYSQWRPSVLVYSVLIGLTLFFVFEKKFQSNFLEKLSKLSFFVFFIHVAVLESFWILIGKNLFNLMSQSFLQVSIML